MSQAPSKNQRILHQPPAQKPLSVKDVRQGGDQRLARISRNLARHPDAFVSFDRQWRVTYINPQAESLLQKTREELLGKILWEALPEALGSTFYRKYREALETHTSVRFEEFYPPLNKWFEVEAYRSKKGMTVYFQDITQHKQAKKALFNPAAMVESSDDAIFSKTLDGIVLSWNTGAERLYGYSVHEMIGQSMRTLVPPERRQEWEEIMQRMREGQRIEHVETVRSRKDGRRIDVSITVSPVRDATGKIIGASTIARDITERNQRQDQLRASEQRFRALIEKSSDAFVLLDTNGMLLYVSPSTTRLLGYTPDELVGRSAFELIHSEDAESIAHALAALVQEPSKGPKAEFRARHQDGTFRWFEGIGTNLLADPSVGAIVGNFRDITERKRAGERQRLLDEASNVLVSSLDHQLTLPEIAQLIVPALADYCRIALVDEQQQIKEITVNHIDPEKIALVRESVQRSPELLHIIRALGLESYMGIPLLVRGKTIGVMTFSSVHPHRRYSQEDLSFAQELARRIALALDNARLYEEAQEEIRVRKQIEAALRESEAWKGAVFETALDAIVTMDHLGRIVEFNPAAEKTFGYTRQEVVGLALAELIIPASLRERHRRGLAHYLATGEGPVMDRRVEIVALRKDGSEFPIELAITRVPKEGDHFFTGTIRDITERKRAEEQQRMLQNHILALVTTDPITTLPNYRGLMDRLEQEVERAQRYTRSCAVLFLDLDHFKALNDGYGHTAGDAVLCEFAGLVQTQLRRRDTVGRWGGEEFVAILPERQADEALVLAEKVRATVAAHTFRVGGGLHLTCSVGMASYPVHAREREGLLSAADHAMYGAKRFGRNQVRAANDPAVLALFSESHREEGREEAALVGMVEALVTLVEARDDSTGRHSHQVADLMLQLARALGLPPAEAQMITLAGRLHDVGKVVIPDAVLQKVGPLAEEEWELIRTHPVVGASVVSHIPVLRPLAPVIRAHHERWDGQGYPDHLKGETIPLGARILMAVDAYLAMTVDRPYQKACAPAAALAELCRCAGSQFDPHVVEALTFLLRHPDQRSDLLARE
jgi:diguanylate cyclase (GGDEF)-like protein/PAS domain S-box-containing protein